MSADALVEQAYLEAVIRVYEPWRDLPLPPAELRLARERVRTAQAELTRLRDGARGRRPDADPFARRT